MNTFGTLFRLTSFGESHGAAIGGVIDGMPAGIVVDYDLLHSDLRRRRPGQSDLTTSRNEQDEVELLSGILPAEVAGVEAPADTVLTTGTPIGFIVRNSNQHSGDYDNLRDVFRPSHADFTYQQKYGIRDHRGGGRSSARETVARIVAGAFAKMVLRQEGITIQAYTSQVGDVSIPQPYTAIDLSLTETNAVRCPDPEAAARMEALIREVKAQGDTIGGTITCVITGCPVGLGEPVFGKLHQQLGAAMLSINACHGFDYGAGFEGIAQRGSEQNDIWEAATHATNSATNSASNSAINNASNSAINNASNGATNSTISSATTLTNNSGGIQGGISNGQDIVFRALFKPVATLLREQPTIDRNCQPASVKARGRHDPCVLPRAVPIVEAMAAITLLDNLLIHRAYR